MKPRNYRHITTGERVRLEALMEKNILDGISDIVRETTDWLSTPEAGTFFMERQGLINQFFRESGIHDRWEAIIAERAERGADIAEQVYKYCREVNAEDVIEYVGREKQILNNICDNQYELVVNVTQQEVAGIRHCILEDVASGVNPRQTSLREVQLEPINGWSPEQRAVVISRTETARCINSATLEQYRSDGITMVELLTTDPCPECEEIAAAPVPIEQAIEIGVVHPNCRCSWAAVVPEI